MKPYIHAQLSTKRYGGVPEDYMDIHELMDSSKAVIADNRHRALTHNSWFVGTIINRVFGSTRVNSEGKTYSTRDIAEEHVLEDYRGRFIPSAQDFLTELEMKDWMQNGKGSPPSFAKIAKKIKEDNRRIPAGGTVVDIEPDVATDSDTVRLNDEPWCLSYEEMQKVDEIFGSTDKNPDGASHSGVNIPKDVPAKVMAHRLRETSYNNLRID